MSGFSPRDNGPQYVIKPGAEPVNVRVDAEGNLWGEVEVILVQACVDEPSVRVWSATERRMVPGRFVPEVPEDLPGRGLKPDPLEARTVAEFVDAMRRYRQWAGAPSYREMADRVGVGSPSRFCEILKNSDRLPSFSLLNAFITSLQGSSAEFQRWAAAWRELLDREQAGAPRVLAPR